MWRGDILLKFAGVSSQHFDSDSITEQLLATLPDDVKSAEVTLNQKPDRLGLTVVSEGCQELARHLLIASALGTVIRMDADRESIELVDANLIPAVPFGFHAARAAHKVVRSFAPRVPRALQDTFTSMYEYYALQTHPNAAPQAEEVVTETLPTRSAHQPSLVYTPV